MRPARAGDWPQILGPNRDGVAANDERLAALRPDVGLLGGSGGSSHGCERSNACTDERYRMLTCDLIGTNTQA